MLNTAKAKGSEIRNVTLASTIYLCQPYSPDGKWLAVIGHDKSKKNPNILIINKPTGDTHLLTGIAVQYPMAITWTNKNELKVLVCHEGRLYSGDETTVSVSKTFEPASKGFVTPDGNELLTARRFSKEDVLVKYYNLKNQKSREIFRGKLGDGQLLSFQYASYCNEATFSTYAYKDPNSIFIDAKRDCRIIRIGNDPSIDALCGVAIWKPGMIAMVKKDYKGGKPDRVIIREMKCLDR